MNTEKNMSAEEILIKVANEHSYEDWGELMYDTHEDSQIQYAKEAMQEYASQQNKDLIEQLRTESDCVEHMKDVEVNYKKEIEELKAENERTRELLDKAFELHNNLNEAGQIGIGSKWAESFNELTKAINNLTPNNNEK